MYSKDKFHNDIKGQAKAYGLKVAVQKRTHNQIRLALTTLAPQPTWAILTYTQLPNGRFDLEAATEQDANATEDRHTFRLAAELNLVVADFLDSLARIWGGDWANRD